MRRVLALLAGSTMVLTCAYSWARGSVKGNKSDQLIFGKAIRYYNMTVVPVGTRARGPFQRYTLLEQGVRMQTLAVRELDGNAGRARVAFVEVRNTGPRPAYLLGGEMILGGKQDRIISRDTVIDNDRRWTKVGVFCVEQGRWRGQKMKFGAGGAIAHVKLRLAAMKASQRQVWAEVARKNAEQKTTNATSTYRRTIQNAKVRGRIAPYREKLLAKLPRDMKIAGVVFAINGKVRVADIFGNPLLFRALRAKLMSAYILEALGHKRVANAPALDAAKAGNFVNQARASRKQRKRRRYNGKRTSNVDFDGDSVSDSVSKDRKTGKTLRETIYAH
ncbi:MAG: hypothetical protein KC503_06975 [Myxococcales bacterium]|nr:hypothetical protein [Myxococcales bacterium]